MRSFITAFGSQGAALNESQNILFDSLSTASCHVAASAKQRSIISSFVLEGRWKVSAGLTCSRSYALLLCELGVETLDIRGKETPEMSRTKTSQTTLPLNNTIHIKLLTIKMCFGSKSAHQPYSTRPNVRYNSKPMTTADYKNYKYVLLPSLPSCSFTPRPRLGLTILNRPTPIKYNKKSKKSKAGYYGGDSSGGGFWGGFGGSGDGG